MASTKKNPYASLIGSSGTLHFAGIDQGIDFTGSGPVYALDTGTITRVEKGGTGWPGQGALVVEKLTSGPAAGSSVYYAEDLTPAAKIALGQPVTKGQEIAYATGSGLAPGIEVGWAQPSGIPVAPLPPPRPASQVTQEGQGFLYFVGHTNAAPDTLTPTESGSAAGAESFGFKDFLNRVPDTLKYPPGVGSNPPLNAGNLTKGLANLWNDIGSPFGLNLPKGWLLRGSEIIAGSILLLLALGIVGLGAVRSSQQTVARAVR